MDAWLSRWVYVSPKLLQRLLIGLAGRESKMNCIYKVRGALTFLIIHQNAKATLLFCISLSLFLGCRDASPPSQRSGTGVVTVRNAQELEFLLPLGMSTNDLLARYGSANILEVETGFSIWTYYVSPISAGDDMPGVAIIGVSLDITNGVVVRRGPVYTASAAPPGEMVLAQFSNCPPLAFHVVHTNQIEQGRLIDTTIFPRLGYVTEQPGLLLTNIAFIKILELQRSGPDSQQRHWFWEIHLGEAETLALAEFTHEHLFERVLIAADNEWLTTAWIGVPIVNGKVRVGFHDQFRMESLRKRLWGESK